LNLNAFNYKINLYQSNPFVHVIALMSCLMYCKTLCNTRKSYIKDVFGGYLN